MSDLILFRRGAEMQVDSRSAWCPVSRWLAKIGSGGNQYRQLINKVHVMPFPPQFSQMCDSRLHCGKRVSSPAGFSGRILRFSLSESFRHVHVHVAGRSSAL